MKKIEKEGLKYVAYLMCIAARTAPKARGIDNILTEIIENKEKEKLAKEMEKISLKIKDKNFIRDANNVRNSGAVVLIGTKLNPIGLNCGLCKGNCEEAKQRKRVCAFNLNDLGIALGSAVSIAADLRCDNRIMYRVGIAAKLLNLIKDAEIIMGIPLSVSGKNIFFDR